MFRILPLFLLVLISFIFSTDRNIYNNQNIFLSNYVSKIKFVQYNEDFKVNHNYEIKEALIFNKNLLLENFILPNSLKLPLYRKMLENYYT